MALQLIVTNAGRAALVNAAHSGTAPVLVAQLGLSGTAVAANPTLTALAGEYKRLAAVSGDVVAPDTIHMVATDEGGDVYTVRAIGLYLADGTLFAVYGQAAPIIEKAAAAIMLMAIDVQFVDIAAASLTFGDTNFLNPPATETVKGVAELATQAESDAGIDDLRIVTPKKLRSSFLSWVASLFSDVWRASNDGSGSGLDADLLDGQHGSYFANIPARLGYTPLDTLSYTPLDVRTKLLDVDGSGSGLDADLLDGQQGSWYANIPARLGYTPANKAGDEFSGQVAIAYPSTYVGMIVRVPSANPATVAHSILETRNENNVTVSSIVTSIETDGSSRMHFTLTPSGARNSTRLFTAGLLTPTGFYINNNTAWHGGNDGSGSALDADMLDGFHASAFLRNQVNLWLTSSEGLGRFYFAGNGITHFGTSAGGGWRWQAEGVERASLTPDGSFTVNGELGARLNVYSSDGTAVARLQPSGELSSIRAGGASGAVFFGSTGTRYLHYDGASYNMPGGDLYVNGGKAWHSGNDGSGSGLDADMLDGFHASAFMMAGAASSGSNANGIWERLPGGLIIQRGRVTHYQTEAVSSVTFPIAFTDAASIVVSATGIYGSLSDDNWPQVYGLPAVDHFSVMTQGTTSAEASYGFHWIAIGR